MKKAIVVVLIGTFAAFLPSLWAQWPDYPHKSVPRLADGQPDLNAPTPRTADGKVDFSGIWGLRGGGGGGGGGGRGQGAGRGQAGGARGQDAAGAGAAQGQNAAGAGAGGTRGQRAAAGAGGPQAPAAPSGPPVATFFNLGQNIPGGLPFQPWAAELMKKRMADNMKDNPDAHCLPIGLTQLHLHPQPRKIVQTPELMVIMYESNGGLRQIFLDGRPSPDNDPLPWWYGYSIGRWEGDTLVVTTTHVRDLGWLDVNGSPLTSQGKIIERFRRPNFGNLEIDVTIDDPKAYTAPFTVRINQRIMVDTELIEFICNENEKSSQYYDK